LPIPGALREAGTLLSIPLANHDILGWQQMDPIGTGWRSFRKAGIL
jgi:hypothetical protein